MPPRLMCTSHITEGETTVGGLFRWNDMTSSLPLLPIIIHAVLPLHPRHYKRIIFVKIQYRS